MGDGMIGHESKTAPDLIEPVIGFRRFKIGPPQPAREAITREVWSGPSPDAFPFVEPNEFVVDPVTGKLVKNYEAIAEAYKKWQASLGKKKIIETPARPATPGSVLSPHTNYEWGPEVQEATCNKLDSSGYYTFSGDRRPRVHVAPEGRCECGFYSYYEAKEAYEHLSAGTAVGIVSQWGKIEAHAKGMRSQYMKIEAMCCYKDEGDWLKEAWNIPVFSYTPGGSSVTTILEPVAKEFGSPLPESMRPKALSSALEEEIRRIEQMQAFLRGGGTVIPYSLYTRKRKRHRIITGLATALCWTSGIAAFTFVLGSLVS